MDNATRRGAAMGCRYRGVLMSRGLRPINFKSSLATINKIDDNDKLDSALKDIDLVQTDGYGAISQLGATPTINRLPCLYMVFARPSTLTLRQIGLETAQQRSSSMQDSLLTAAPRKTFSQLRKENGCLAQAIF